MATELASGFISLTVKYGDAMKQLNKDFTKVSGTAQKSGTKAGSEFSKGFGKESAKAAKGVDGALKGADAAAAKHGKSSGSKFAQAFQSETKKAKAVLGGADMGAGATAGGMKIGKLLGAGMIAGLAAAGLTKVVDTVIDQFKSVIDVGLSYEKQMNNLKGVTGASAADMKKLGDTARALGSDVNLAGTSSADAASALTELAKAGLTADQAISASRGTLQLATAGQISAAEAAEMVSTAMNVFSLDFSKGTQVADDFAAAVLASSLDMPDLAQAMQAGASAGASFGISMEDTLATLGTFAQLGIKGSDAGTMMKTSLLAWQSPSEAQAGAMADLNLQLEDANGNFVGYREMMGQLETASKRMTQAEFNNAAATLYGTDAFRAAALVRIGATKHWDRIRGEINKEGQAAEMAAAQMGGATGAIEGFNNTMEGIRLDVWEHLGPVIESSMKDLAGWFSENKDTVVGFFVSIADAALVSTDAILKAMGLTAEGIGQLIAPLGDVHGASLRVMATLKRLGGDTELADKLDAEADSAFGWGEGLTAAGKAMQDFDPSKLHKDLEAVGTKAAASQANVDLLKTGIETLPDGHTIVIKDTTPENIQNVKDLGYAVNQLPDGRMAIRIEYKDTDGNIISPDQLRVSQRQQSAAAGNENLPGHARGGTVRGKGGTDNVLAWLTAGEGVVTKGAMANGGASLVAALNAGWTPPVAMLKAMLPGFAQGLSPGADQLRSILMQQWPSLVNVNGDVGRQDSYGEHSSGNALDVMIPDYKSEDGIAMGNAVKDFVVDNAGTLGLQWAIWRDKIYKPGGSVSSYGNPSSSDDNSQHRNHVHVFLAGKGVKAPAFSASALTGGGGTGGRGGGTRKATPAQLSAAQDRITDLQNRLDVDEQALTEYEANPKSKPSTLQRAKDKVEKDKRELEQAKQKLTDLEAQVDSAANDAADTALGGGSGSDNPFVKITEGIGQLMDLGVEGFKESFMPPGFSDPTQWPAVKSLGGMLGFLGGLVGGFPGTGAAGGLLSTLGAGITGSGSGVVSGIASMIPQPFGTLENPAVTADQFANAGVAQGVGTGPLPGPGGVPAAPGAAGVDNSVHIGQVNDDAGTVLDKTQRQQASAQVPHLGTRRFV